MYNNVKNVRTLSYTTLRLIWQERKENNHKDFWQKERKKPKLKKNVGFSTRIKGKLWNMNQCLDKCLEYEPVLKVNVWNMNQY